MKKLLYALSFLLLAFAGNGYSLFAVGITPNLWYIWLLSGIAGLAVLFLLPFDKQETKRLTVLHKGNCGLIMFVALLSAEIPSAIVFFIAGNVGVGKNLIFAGIAAGVLFLLFWISIITVYLTSVQLGIRIRTVALLCGMIPVLNLVMLFFIISITRREVADEVGIIRLNRERKPLMLAATEYPILMVHGVFFRDSKRLDYWGRIPEHLKENGARIYYGNQESAASVEDSGKELCRRILEIIKDTGAEKLNVIAHSKGGLDVRYAATHTEAGKYIASITTIDTPHRGCFFAEALLKKFSPGIQNSVAAKYNFAAKRLGDTNPDFLAAVRALTVSACEKFNAETPDNADIYYSSVGAVLTHATGGKFPLNIAYPLVSHYDGETDGLVSLTSASWGSKFTVLRPTGNRGISHADMIDLNRENIVGFDVREFYLSLVNDLKMKGF